MNSKPLQKAGAAGVVALLVGALAGCGGGGGSSGDSGGSGNPPPSSALAQGLYSGTLSGSTSTQFRLLVLENNDIWTFYGVPSGSSFVARGFIQGSTIRTASNISSASVKDFGVNPAPTGTISGSISNEAVSGLINFSGAQISFSGNPPATTAYDYNTPANIALVTGAWTLGLLDGTTAAVTIAADGTISGNNAGCLFSGRATPRASGKNVFDVSLTTGAAPCREPGTTSTGVAVTYLLPNSSTRELLVAVVNPSRTAGNAFFGVR